MAWWQRQFGKTTRGKIVALLRRAERSVEELAESLGVTDNAVRAQLVTLEREGVVRAIGIRRDGAVGKPATLYGIATGTSGLFSSAYLPALTALLAELRLRMNSSELDALLRDAGRRLAPTLPAQATFGERAQASAGFLTAIGGDVDLVQTAGGYEIRGYACPLAEAVAVCPTICNAVEECITEVTGTPARERCDRSHEPRCRFFIPSPP